MLFVCACSAVSDSVQPRGLYPTRLFCPWDSPGRNMGVGAMPSPGDLPDPGIEGLMFPALVGRFLYH